jgi:formylglycine-generating enzyme required for sulfatase activity
MKTNQLPILLFCLACLMACTKELAPLGSAVFTVQNGGCEASCEVTFSAPGGSTRYRWDFDDGTTTTGQTAKKTYAYAGNYRVKLIVSGDGGSAISSQIVNIRQKAAPAPVASFSFSGTNNFTAPCTVNFTNTSTNATSYTWDFGVPGATSAQTSPSYSYTAAGSYTVRLTATGAGGTNTAPAQTVTIAAPVGAQTPVVSLGTVTEQNTTFVQVALVVTSLPTPLSRYGVCFSETNSTPIVGGTAITLTYNSDAQPVGQQLFRPGDPKWGFNGTAGSAALKPGTRYYYRTFAESKVGTTTAIGYGAQVQEFTTLPNPTATTREYLPGVTFSKMVLVTGGTFQMGDTRNEGYSEERPVHTVTVSSFYMAQYEVTQRQWQNVMGSNPAYFKGCDDCPVEQVSHDDIQTFLAELNKKRPANTPAFRLPTEAEWEYAAREGGKDIRFGNGKDIAKTSEMNFDGSAAYKASYSEVGVYRAKTTQVGSFDPNALGLFDMSGNVWEWCQDWYGAYSSAAQTNPPGPSSGADRVLRGGSWLTYPQDCRSAYRFIITPTARNYDYGFRVVSQSQ